MWLSLVARNATQALSREPIASMPSDEEGRTCDQQGWYRGKRLPSLDGREFLILMIARQANTVNILEVSMEIELDQIEQQALQALGIHPG